MRAPASREQLQAFWLRSLPSPQAGAQPAFERVLACWSEPQRAYHTVQHLGECLHLLEEWHGAEPWPATVALALFFHDAVYDPQRGDNEEMSARLAREMLAPLQVPDGEIDTIVRLIDITRHAAVPESDDEKCIVDIDLAILGAAPARYAQYRAQVGQEYAHVPEALFVRGRLAVLEGFLNARPALYHTARARRAFDAAAARNLTAEIGELRAALRP